MLAEQLTFWEAPKRSSFARQVEKYLRMYPALKAALESDELFPAITARYGDDSPRGTDISKPTEIYAIRRAEKAQLVQRIERALDTLNERERELIELKYFSPLIRSDLAIYEKLGYSERQGRRIKDAALRKLATALNLI